MHYIEQNKWSCIIPLALFVVVGHWMKRLRNTYKVPLTPPPQCLVFRKEVHVQNMYKFAQLQGNPLVFQSAYPR